MADESKPVPWSTVVESDRVLSEKTGRWYEVLEIAAVRGDKVRVRFVNVVKPQEIPAATMVTVQRGATGKVVDMFVQVLASGPSAGAR